MLGPNFKEGTLLRESRGPTEIVLPDDNAEALWNVYSTLYGAHPRVRDLGPDEIYDVSILAQKYDLADRLALACGAWFQRADDAYYDSESSFKLLVAAYWLGCESGFAYVSRFLVREAGETIYRQAMESTDQVLGLKLCCEYPNYPCPSVCQWLMCGAAVAVEELRLNEAVSDESETGLCLSCFKNPKTEKFWIKRDDCPSFYDWVLP